MLDYYKLKPVYKQVGILADAFGLPAIISGPNNNDLPHGAEGLFAIPRWQAVAHHYGDAVQKALDILAKNRTFYNFRKGELGPDHLRRLPDTQKALDKLQNQQNSDILVVPAQFGKRHKGKSVTDARQEMVCREFGLGAFEIACMLITHPDRLQKYDDLWIDCAGDEYDFEAWGQWLHAPYFNFSSVDRGGGLSFNADDISVFCDGWASASCFLPQFEIAEQTNRYNQSNQSNQQTTMQKLTNTLRRVLSADLQAQYKAGIINGALELTEPGRSELLSILAQVHTKELAERAQEIIKEEEDEK